MQDILEQIRKSQKIVVLGHVNPDVDCITSSLVLSSALSQQAKHCRLLLDAAAVPRRLAFMLDYLRPQFAQPADLQTSELIVVGDTAHKPRICLQEGFDLPADQPICNIDHHLGNEGFGDFNWVDPAAGSTTQMILMLLDGLACKISPQMATLLYAGLHADTCGLAIDTVTGQSLKAAAQMADLGAQIGWICRMLYRNCSPQEVKLLKIVFANTRVAPTGQVAWSSISKRELHSSGSKPSDIDEQVSVPRSISGVKIALLFCELESGKIRVNLRSEDRINILPLAQRFGGGGHAQAAGVMTGGKLDQVVQTVVAAAQEHIKNLESHENIENRHNIEALKTQGQKTEE